MGNVASLQLFGFCIALALAAGAPAHPNLGLVNAGWLTVLVLLKPNCALLVAQRLGMDPRLVAAGMMVTCAAVLAALPLFFARQEEARRDSRTPLEWAAFATVVTLASTPLVWYHYYVLALIPSAFLTLERCVPRGARRCGIAGFLAVAGPIRAGSQWLGMGSPPYLDVLETLSWLPLAVGLVWTRIAPALRRPDSYAGP